MPDRILTTDVRSLPRGSEVSELLFAAQRGDAIDTERIERVVAAGVEETVRRQISPRRAPADLEAFPGFLECQAKGGATLSYRLPRCVAELRPVTLVRCTTTSAGSPPLAAPTAIRRDS